MTKNIFTKKELRKLGFSEDQITELIDRTGRALNWLAMDVKCEPEKLIRDAKLTKKQIKILKEVVLKDFPFERHTFASCKAGEFATVYR